ncbi:putative adhesin [Thalassomonas sp. RHCl1]|uniref:putative adhesin n=1 Tax=Thalassomonas sp. RHCl1 TaxID=2995320 RepID=UPI00248D1D0A|nr:hypothetical protein [Thalassomonas sp. RHCl1]
METTAPKAPQLTPMDPALVGGLPKVEEAPIKHLTATLAMCPSNRTSEPPRNASGVPDEQFGRPVELTAEDLDLHVQPTIKGRIIDQFVKVHGAAELARPVDEGMAEGTEHAREHMQSWKDASGRMKTNMQHLHGVVDLLQEFSGHDAPSARSMAPTRETMQEFREAGRTRPEQFPGTSTTLPMHEAGTSLSDDRKINAFETKNLLIFNFDQQDCKRAVIHCHGGQLHPYQSVTDWGSPGDWLKPGGVEIPEDTTMTILAPHGKKLQAPLYLALSNDLDRLGVISEHGSTVAQNHPEVSTRELTGLEDSGSNQGKVANYNLSHAKEDGVIKGMQRHVENSESKHDTPLSDVIALKEDSEIDLNTLLKELAQAGIHYDEVVVLFCRNDSEVSSGPSYSPAQMQSASKPVHEPLEPMRNEAIADTPRSILSALTQGGVMG